LFTPHRVNVAAPDTTSPYTGVAASIDLGTVAAGHLDTVVQARLVGVQGNDITVAATGSRSDGTVVITEVGHAVAITYDDDVSTVANVEAAIASQSTLIEVATPGTGATVLDAATDDFTAQLLTGGEDSIPKLHGFECHGWDDIAAQVIVDGSDVDLEVLFWSDAASRFIPASPAITFANLTTSTEVRFTTGGVRFFIHVSGTFDRVDIACAGTGVL
jgi:hypothetical protein